MGKAVIQNIVQQLFENYTEASAVVVMELSGNILYSFTRDAKFPIQALSTEMWSVIALMGSTADILQSGDFEECTVRSELFTFIIRFISGKYVLGLAIQATHNYGKGRYWLRIASAKVREDCAKGG